MINKEKIINYIKMRSSSLPEHRFGSINVIIKDQFINDINLHDVFDQIEKSLPDHILSLVDIIYVGDFEFLNEKTVNAAYLEGAIYTSNAQDSESDIIDDIVHEFSHAIEEKYDHFIYGDGLLEEEFLLKRSRLKRILTYQEYDISKIDFFNVEFDPEFDSFMYEEIGYEKLNGLSRGIFLGAYSITSLREYFARGIEEFYLGDWVYLQKLCPYIYKKALQLHEDDLETGLVEE